MKMTRGRRPLSQEFKELTGAFRKDPQRRASAAPKADGQSPAMPKWFNRIEKAKWNELIGDLKRNGVLSTDTRELLIAYCTSFAGWLEAKKKVKEFGLAIESVDKHGNQVIAKNPYVAELHKFREQLNRLLPEFGLTPSSRQKLKSLNIDDPKDDPFAQIMKRMAGN
jgi:P27 family predicted phage terminase small subunit